MIEMMGMKEQDDGKLNEWKVIFDEAAAIEFEER